MRTSKVWPIVTVCVAAFAAPLLAGAQQPPAARNAPPPPKLEKLEEGEAPSITIRKPESERKITEKREKGKVTEVKVKSGKSTYYLKPNEPAGSALPGDTESNAIRAPQWQVLEFDWGRPTQDAKEVAGAQTAPAAPPPSLPPSPAK